MEKTTLEKLNDAESYVTQATLRVQEAERWMEIATKSQSNHEFAPDHVAELHLLLGERRAVEEKARFSRRVELRAFLNERINNRQQMV